jgi:hypothetical protein
MEELKGFATDVPGVLKSCDALILSRSRKGAL